MHIFYAAPKRWMAVGQPSYIQRAQGCPRVSGGESQRGRIVAKIDRAVNKQRFDQRSLGHLLQALDANGLALVVTNKAADIACWTLDKMV